jgi:hypothetical protein
VDVISREGPEVSTRKTEADDVLDELDVIKDKPMNFWGKIRKCESILTTLGFGPLMASWGAKGSFAIDFALYLPVSVGLLDLE